MSAILTVARKEFQSAFRSSTLVTITVLFLGLSVLSAYIGSTTKHAEMTIYNETVTRLTAGGAAQLPVKPDIHALTMLGNLSEYVAIVGAILAIMLGYRTISEERESGGLQLILTRPVFRDQLLTGKVVGNGAVVAMLLGLVFAFNIVLLAVVGHVVPSGFAVARIGMFVLVAFVYMMLFLLLSIFLSINMKNSASVFLVSLVVWMTSAFVLSQIADTLMTNSTVMNTVSGTTNQIPQDTVASSALNFISPTWHLRSVGSTLLEVTPGSANLAHASLFGQFFAEIFVLLVPCVVLGVMAYISFGRSQMLTGK